MTLRRTIVIRCKMCGHIPESAPTGDLRFLEAAAQQLAPCSECGAPVGLAATCGEGANPEWLTRIDGLLEREQRTETFLARAAAVGLSVVHLTPWPSEAWLDDAEASLLRLEREEAARLQREEAQRVARRAADEARRRAAEQWAEAAAAARRVEAVEAAQRAEAAAAAQAAREEAESAAREAAQRTAERAARGKSTALGALIGASFMLLAADCGDSFSESSATALLERRRAAEATHGSALVQRACSPNLSARSPSTLRREFEASARDLLPAEEQARFVTRWDAQCSDEQLRDVPASTLTSGGQQ